MPTSGPNVAKNPQHDNTSSRLPDLAFIRERIPIEQVWNELADESGLEPVKNHMTRCFRPEAHQNGDRTASLHFSSRTNRAKCHVCDARYFSNLDLVQAVFKCDLRFAIRWFMCHHWTIPAAQPGRPRGSVSRPPRPFRVGIGGALEVIVRSGLFGEMNWPAAKLLVVLSEVQNERREVEWSYLALQRATGIASSDTLHNAIKELRDYHMLTVRKEVRLGEKNAHNIYRLTLDDAELHEMVSSAYNAHTFANAEERRLRAEARKRRFHDAKTNEYKHKDN